MAFFARYNPDNLAQRISSGSSTEFKKRVVIPEGVTMQEVSKHNARDDCWVVIDAKAYEMSSWIDKHPGGDILMSYAGMDATDVFAAFHDDSTYNLLKSFYIGEVKDPKTSPLTEEHRKMKKILEEQNMFESNKFYFAYKLLTNLTLLSMSVFTIAHFETSWRVVPAGLFLAFFWQQCGWLSHDFLHHQVFKNRKLNNFIGYIVGNVFQGFSVSWWKAKHNLHHAVPNVAGFDPDIDTLPFLAWSEKLIDGQLTGLPHVLIKYQYIFYFPLMSAARISWLIQSLMYADKKSRPAVRNIEIFTLMLHYTWFFGIMFLFLSFSEAILFALVSQASTGLLLATAFSLNHNAMPILPSGTQSEMEFSVMQILTGRDVSGLFVNWFMGGLDKQIEHHLFPKLPRHNLPALQKLVEPVCAKHNIPYHKTGFFDGSLELFSQLYTVSGNFEKSSK